MPDAPAAPNPLPQPRSGRLLGAHMPTAGGLHRALTGGRDIGCGVVQLFTANPRQWEPPALTDEAAALYRQTRIETGIQLVVSHDSYLINLAAPDPVVHKRSFDAFVREIERCTVLGIPWVVTHLGCHLGSGEDEGLRRLGESVGALLRETAGAPVGIALETTAGQGTCLGADLAHIAYVLEACSGDARVGTCLDTCHLFAAGYDVSDERGYEATVEELGRLVGFERVQVVHVNDARKGLGSRVDRHEHLGRGGVGMRAVARLAADPRLAHAPLVVETPQAEKMHGVNLARLRRVEARGELGMVVSVAADAAEPADEAVDGAHDEVELPWGATVADLAVQVGRLRAQASDGVLTVNGVEAAWDTVLFEADVVACEVPPTEVPA